jgi:uncharacterized membrane protein HdeD (DUF308 family)
MPGLSLYGLALLVAVWAFITGIFEIISSVKLRKIINDKFVIIFSGLLSIVFGILIFLKPLEGIVVMTYLIGIYAVLFGILFIFFGITMRKQHLEYEK